MDKNSELFNEFPPVSTEEWEEVIAKDLGGADYKKKLRWDTGEGIQILPFYRREHLKDLPASSRTPLKLNRDWEIRHTVFEHDIEKANFDARDALDRGSTGVNFNVRIRYADGMLGGDVEGTAVQNQDDFNQLLKHINLKKHAVHFDAGIGSPALAAMLKNFCTQNDLNPSTVHGSFLYDPYAFILKNGILPKNKQQMVNEAGQMARFCTGDFPNFKTLGVDGHIFHDSGATLVQELGFALATGSEYLASLSDSGISTGKIAGSLHFNFSVGTNYFLEIAKLRAARILWKKILKAYRAEDQRMYIHAKTSEWNKTISDPYTNMLRSATEGISAAIAGCDAITITPFDTPFRQPGNFSSRIARNQQIVMKEEAYLNKVSNPSAGSYYIEQLTDKIAEEAWNCFREVENQGGMLQSILDRYIQISIEQSRKEKDCRIALTNQIFVGTNQYPNPEEELPDNSNRKHRAESLVETDTDIAFNESQIIDSIAEALTQEATLGDIVSFLFDISKLNIRPLRPYRGTEAFEELRRATQKQPETPKVLTLPLGNKKLRKARSSFTANFFGCAGYDIEDPIGFQSVDEAVDAVRNSSPDIAVLCSSDKKYKELVPELCKKLDMLEHKPIVVLAGYPESNIETYKQAGIDEFIHSGSNVLKTLINFQIKLGIIADSQ